MIQLVVRHSLFSNPKDCEACSVIWKQWHVPYASWASISFRV